MWNKDGSEIRVWSYKTNKDVHYEVGTPVTPESNTTDVTKTFRLI